MPNTQNSNTKSAMIVTTQGKKGRWFWKLVRPGHNGIPDRTLATGTGSYVDETTALETAEIAVEQIVSGTRRFKEIKLENQNLAKEVRLAKEDAADAHRSNANVLEEHEEFRKRVRYGAAGIAIAGILVGYLLSLL